MVSINAAASHLLLNKKGEGASHSIEKSGASSAFQTYGYGPMDLPDADKKAAADGSGAKPVSGTSSIAAVGGSASTQFLAHLMGAAGRK
jgi:hypothetical protein